MTEAAASGVIARCQVGATVRRGHRGAQGEDARWDCDRAQRYRCGVAAREGSCPWSASRRSTRDRPVHREGGDHVRTAVADGDRWRYTRGADVPAGTADADRLSIEGHRRRVRVESVQSVAATPQPCLEQGVAQVEATVIVVHVVGACGVTAVELSDQALVLIPESTATATGLGGAILPIEDPPARSTTVGSLSGGGVVEADLLDVTTRMVDGRLAGGEGAAAIPTGIIHVVGGRRCAVQLQKGHIGGAAVDEQ